MHDYSYYFPTKTPQFHIIKSQKELLKLLASGLTLREIAVLTNKKLNNIKKRVQLLYKKFEVNSRQKLISAAIKKGLISTYDVTKRFKKRFTRIKSDNKKIIQCPNLSERELKLLKLRAQNIKQTILIEQLNLWSYYGLKQLEFHVCEKFETENILQAICIAKKLEII